MSAAAVQGAVPRSADVLTRLAARLSDPQDREGYAELIAYIRSLPADDEFVKVAQLLGFLTLLGQELPHALTQERGELQRVLDAASAAFHQEVETNRSYHEQLQQRLTKLPEEIADSVKPADIAKTMSEAFRQQIAATGLQETKTVLDAATSDLKKTTADLDKAITPLTDKYNQLATKIETQTSKLKTEATALKTEADNLTFAANALERKNAELRTQVRELEWYYYVAIALALVLAGFVVGTMYEQSSVGSRVDSLQRQLTDWQQTRQAPAPSPTPSLPKNKTPKSPKRETPQRP